MRMLEHEHWVKLKEYLRLSSDPKDIIVELALHTGARVSELIRLTRSNFRGGKVYIKASKNSKDRAVTINEDLFLKIKLLDLKAEDRLVSLFTKTKNHGSIRRMIHRHVDFLTYWLTGEAYSMHCLRHTIFSMLYRQTGDIYLVKQWAGHKSLASTLEYVHVNQIERAEEILSKVLGD